ncbi:MAG: Gfo/Idh/MocA family oxidoreductase [Thermoguttaceae bacterium]
MKRFNANLVIATFVLVLIFSPFSGSDFSEIRKLAKSEEQQKVFRLGVIGATTSHVPAFVGLINDPNGTGLVPKYQVVAAYAGGMPDNPSSWERVPEYSKYLTDNGITIYPTVEEMLEHVDGVLLESVDGRPHLEQAKPVIAAKKPLYIDKPMAGSLSDVIEIFDLAEANKVPVFSASSLRYSTGFQQMRNEMPLGKIYGCDATSPCAFNEQHPDLFWYGVHGVETLFTIMGTGCESVSRTHADSCELVVGVWHGGRVGTFRGIHQGNAGYGAKVFGEKGIAEAGTYDGYKPLVDEILLFFETGKAPVDAKETVEIFAFMEASDESLKRGGLPVSISETIEKAKKAQFDVKNVEIKVNGKIYVEGKETTKTGLAAALKPSSGRITKVILKSDKGVSLDHVKEVTQHCNRDTVRLANYLYN